jgi:hypothetical protein
VKQAGKTRTEKAGLPDFSRYKIPKREKYTKLQRTIPNVKKYNKRPYNGPSVHKIYQHHQLRDPPKFTQIWIFGLKTNHLATLRQRAKTKYVNK